MFSYVSVHGNSHHFFPGPTMRYCVTEVIVEPSCSVYVGEEEGRDMEERRERNVFKRTGTLHSGLLPPVKSCGRTLAGLCTEYIKCFAPEHLVFLLLVRWLLSTHFLPASPICLHSPLPFPFSLLFFFPSSFSFLFLMSVQTFPIASIFLLSLKTISLS